MAFNFSGTWYKENAHTVPDVLSHHPVITPIQEDTMTEIGKDHYPKPSIAEIRMYQSTAMDSLRLTKLRQCAEEDEEYTQLNATI